jgi:5-(carboxyamino)imidazole ribonucleotide synthase
VRIGILGGGQLAQMLAVAGRPLGHSFVVATATKSAVCPAAPVVDEVLGPYTSDEVLDALAAKVDVVTLETENIPLEVVARLAARVPVRPGRAALAASSDRLVEKSTFQALGIPTVPFRAVADATELDAAVEALGLPAILKTRRLGYDGRGQLVLRTRADVERAKAELPAELILEGFARFTRELSVIAVRSVTGELRCYPLAENQHRDGILRFSSAPAQVEAPVREAAQRYVETLATHLDYVGVLALELFDMNGHLLANEMAPRVHNSGHWTIEGAEISQFENHIRAVAGQPLGPCTARGVSAMINLIGELPEIDELLRIPSVHVHLYAKRPRPGRKLGHLTVTAADHDQLAAAVASVQLDHR